MDKKTIQIKLNEYIDTLLENQKDTDCVEQRIFLNRNDYYLLLRSVLEVIKNNQNAKSIFTYRNELFKKSGLLELIESFVYETRVTPGLVIDFGTQKSRDIILCGYKDEVKLFNNQIIPTYTQVESDTIYDLASTSKFFTCLAIYYLVDAGKIDLFKPITEYCPSFVNLNKVTVYDLLKFRQNIETNGRIDQTKSIKDAEQLLFNAVVNNDKNIYNHYSDMGAMILKYVIEATSKMKFTDFIEEIIIKPLKMEDTYLNVPQDKKERIASENFYATVDQYGIIHQNNYCFKGLVHDPKANHIGHSLGNAPGHAGYFSTTVDMIKLANALLNNEIISRTSLRDISSNKVGEKIDNIYTYYYGSLVYLKQPDPKKLSVYPPLSGRSFMSPGFAGTTLSIDPLNKITMFIGANRLHNRIYKIPDSFIQIDPNGCRYYQNKVVSSTFTRDKEILVKKVLDLAIEYQFLEILFPQEKELYLKREL